MVGNPEEYAALEMTLTGGKYLFNENAFIAVSGSIFHLHLDGKEVPHQRGCYVRCGQELTVGPSQDGARAYLCLRGGVAVPDYLSGKTTHITSGLGGFEGRLILKGDTITIGNLNHVSQPIKLKEVLYIQRDIIRITKCIQSNWFSEDTWKLFTEQTYTVSKNSSRMGIRLTGDPVKSSLGNEILTEGIPLGAIQVPGGGQPIISFVEHQTTGGYPKIANVITADLCKVGQLKPGDQFKFQSVSLEEAEAFRFEQEAFIEGIKRTHD